MRLMFGIFPCVNGSILACLTFRTDWYLWVLPLWYLLFPSLFEFLLVSLEG